MVASKTLRRVLRVLWGDWQTIELWQRILKCVVACTVALIISIHPGVVSVFGTSTFLIVQTAVFAHPGQRMGKMIESLLMVIFGAMLGLAWSLFGLYLSSLVVEDNEPAAYTIRALFLLVSVLFHGYVRSSSPRLFVFVLLMLIASVQILLGGSSVVTIKSFTTICYPVLTGAAVMLAVNIFIFPEFSSSYLGSSTIDTLSQTMDTLTRATHWFVTPGGDAEGLEASRNALDTTASRRSKAPLKQETKRRKGRVRKFFADFPNPFVTVKNQLPLSLVPTHLTTLASLTDRKVKLRAQMARCKAVQSEVIFEISISPLPPRAMKPISMQCMASLVQNTVTLVGACENKFVVIGNDDPAEIQQNTKRDIEQESEQTEEKEQENGQSSSPESSDHQDHASSPGLAAGLWNRIPRIPKEDKHKEKNDFLKRVEDVKPLREIEAGNANLLESILARLRDPVQDFEKSLQEAVALLTSCLAYCFDVSTLPSGAPTPKGIQLEEIDLRIDAFTEALAQFDYQSTEELRQAATEESGRSIDLMPRMEMFLVSSFLLAFRQAATHVLQMLRHARDLVENRRRRHDRSRVWFPHYTSIGQWLSTGGESDGMVLPVDARKSVRRGDNSQSGPAAEDEDDSLDTEVSHQRPSDEEAPSKNLNSNGLPPKKKKRPGMTMTKLQPSHISWLTALRGKTADIMEWGLDSEHVAYALKLALAVFLVSWPALITSWNAWYADIRGVWAPLQLVLVFEVVIGSSIFVFFVRLFGVIFGCTVGYLSYVIARGNRAAMVVVLLFGIIPSVYVQLSTKYVKAGMVSIISMTVVALATLNASGTAYENFYTRLGAFVIGGSVAVLVEVVIYPVRARDRLVECLSSSVREVQNMQSSLAVGIDGPEKPNFRAESLHRRFTHARNKAQGALAAAETFLPFCLTEPRIKGSFKPLAPIYKEIIYVLHQIIDRMDSVVQLRKAYGSSVLEDLNPQVHAYRRNVAASSMLTLFSVNEALTTWLPLPQFIPSTRLAQVRLINRVREVIGSQNSQGTSTDVAEELVEKGEVDEYTARVITQYKFLSWNASAAGQMEIIEYLEELIDLVKLLVGVNAFRSGMLERPNYKQYVEQIKTSESALGRMRSAHTNTSAPAEEPADVPEEEPRPGIRRAATVAQNVGRFKERLKKSKSQTMVPEEPDSDDEDIPRSLQRVGTRIRMENAAVRRRGFSAGNEH